METETAEKAAVRSELGAVTVEGGGVAGAMVEEARLVVIAPGVAGRER